MNKKIDNKTVFASVPPTTKFMFCLLWWKEKSSCLHASHIIRLKKELDTEHWFLISDER